MFIDTTAVHEDVNVSFIQPSIEETPKLPWAQGLNVVSDIVNIKAVSAFNGYDVPKADSPFIVQLHYEPEKLFGLAPTLLSISHFNIDTGRWVPIQNPMVFDYVNNTIATTTREFGFFTVAYPSSVWNR